MSFQTKLIPRYIASAAIPYVLLSLVLLTAILLTQQASRFAELTLYAQVPFSLLGEVGLALLPNVLILTLPMAVLAGTVIGFSRLGSDSEIVAMRSAGVGTWSLLWPVLLIGAAVTLPTTYIHMKEAPRAARQMRRAALQGALRKLDSPVDPRTFNTEIPGYVIYVRDGHQAEGSWGRVFIYSQQQDGSTRLVTARSGRIDSSGDKSELVLLDAVAARLPPVQGTDKVQYVMERLDQLRIAINTGRAAILARLTDNDLSPDEKDWSDLRSQALFGSEKERREGKRVLNRRLALSLSPFVFALIGGALGLRVRRGGRGIGVLLSLAIMISYYLISLLGESLSRAGILSPVIGAWMATILMLLLSLLFLALNYKPLNVLTRGHAVALVALAQRALGRAASIRTAARRWGFPSLLDINLFRTLSLSFFCSYVSLVCIFIIFTLFELWRFIGTNRSAASLVVKYFLFLLPLITVELFPGTMLIAVLVTYALLSRRSESIAWWACGQSVYRLMLPGLIFAVLAAAATWLVQERLMPSSNIRQDLLRAQIRGGEARAITVTGLQWLASAESNRLYSYEYDEQHHGLRDLSVYDFDGEGVHLKSLTLGDTGAWISNGRMLVRKAETISFGGMQIERESKDQTEISGMEAPDVFKPTIDKPSQLSSESLSSYLKSARQRGVDVSLMAVALQRKYAEPFNVLVMAFIGMPLALSFGKRGAIVALSSAVAVSLAYWVVGGGFQQLGNHGLLSPTVAGWSPPLIFASVGTYFLSRIRT